MNFLIPFVPSTKINLGSRGFPGFGSIPPNDKAERGVMSCDIAILKPADTLSVHWFWGGDTGRSPNLGVATAR